MLFTAIEKPDNSPRLFQGLLSIRDFNLLISYFRPCNMVNLPKELRFDSAPSANSSEYISSDKKLDVEEVTKHIDAQDEVIIENGLKRGLLGRHVSLISLASIIGPSCFYAFGYALYVSGPLGALIGFSLVGKFSHLFGIMN